MKLSSPGGKNPTRVLQRLIRSWFKGIRTCSDTFVVYEYRNKSQTRAIQSKHDIKPNVQFLKRFCSGLQLKTIPGDVWFTILAGFDESEEEFKDSTDWWYREHNSGIFKLPLQVPDTIRDIWLFLSHEKIDVATLKEAIVKEATTRLLRQVPFALVFFCSKGWKGL